jgi:flagellar motor switch protein FliG
MTTTNSNLRKAAVLLRSVDADTAATLLAQLSTEEAAALRDAVRALGPIDPDEQADVYAEFRREQPLASEPASMGVELALSSTHNTVQQSSQPASTLNGKRFEFLENAHANTLASYLAREHAQTIAVVLSHIPPERAAAVLATLPEKLQAETMERLSNLGDTDSEVVNALEHEMAAWAKSRNGDAGNRGRRRDTVTSILAAADSKTRDTIVANLRTRNAALAGQIDRPQRARTQQARKPHVDEYRVVRTMAKRQDVNKQLRALSLPQTSTPMQPTVTLPAPTPPPSRLAAPRIDFDQLIHLDSRMLSQLLSAADPNLLALALAGSNDDLVERICDQMPKRVAKAFRRELRRMGPTRLSDVEGAQRAIAELAARQIVARRNGLMPGADTQPVANGLAATR